MLNRFLTAAALALCTAFALVAPAAAWESRGWHHDAEGGFSLHLPAGWSVEETVADRGRGLTALSPAGDALFVLGVSSGPDTDFVAALSQRFYSQVALPLDFLEESDAPFAGLTGMAFTMRASVYPLDDITLPYDEGIAWLFFGATEERNLMLAWIHAEDAPEALRAELAAMAESFVFGPPPDGASAPEAGADAPPDDAPLSAADTVAAVSAALGGDCALREAGAEAVAAALAGSGVTVEAMAGCAAAGVELAVAALPQDPRTAQGGSLRMLYLRAFMAGAGKAVALADPQRRVLVVLRPDGAAGFAAEVTEFAAAATPDLAPAPDPGALFSGAPSPAWELHLARGGSADWTRYEDGAFVADVPAGPDFQATGLRTVEPVVRLPAAGDGFATRLRIGMDTAALDNVVIALVESGLQGNLDWHDHEVWLAIERDGEAVPQLVLAVENSVQRRMPLPDPAVLEGLTIELRPDRLVRVTNGEGRVLAEGRLAEVPGPGPYHLQISATAPDYQLAAKLVLREVVHEEFAFDPAAHPETLLGEAPQELVLFDGLSPGPYLGLHGPDDADLPALIGFDDGLRIKAEAAGQEWLGLHSEEPVIWLDRFGRGAQARLRLEFDAAATGGVQVMLSSPWSGSNSDPGYPRFVAHWRRLPDGALYLGRSLDRGDPLVAEIPAMPEAVEIVLTPDGVQMLAEGFPDTVLPWPALKPGAGLRLKVLAMADHESLPAELALRRVTLQRVPEAPPDAALPPPPAIEPLPVTRLFPAPAAPWEGYSLVHTPFEQSGRFEPDGTLTVSVEPGTDRGRVGGLSAGPVAKLDHRLDKTAYRLGFAFDPALTNGFEVYLSGDRRSDMHNETTVGVMLVRQEEGRRKGDWQLTLQAWSPSGTWTRAIPAADMARWDGRLELELMAGEAKAAGEVAVVLPGILRLHGHDFAGVASGAELFATVHSRSARTYSEEPVQMRLISVEGGWVTPPGMTPRDRLLLLGTDAFDPEEWVRLLREELEETAR